MMVVTIIVGTTIIQNLADLGAAYAAYRGLRRPVVFTGYLEAIDELLLLGAERSPR